MVVYTLDADVNTYRPLFFTDSEHVVEFNRLFDGTPLKKVWTERNDFAFVPRRLPKGDTPGFSTHIPVFNHKAVRALVDLVEGNGELLPITCGTEQYFVFNVTNIIDALDEANCELQRFSSGRIMDVMRYSFFEEKLTGATVFKIPQAVLMDVFVTDPFVERVSKAGLKGFKFRKVWSSC
jgi:hypothetical protein